MWRCEDVDQQMWECKDVDQQMWRCEDVDLQMWRCEDVDQQMWRCEDVDQQMWRCEDVDLQMYYNGCFFTKNPSQALSFEHLICATNPKFNSSFQSNIRRPFTPFNDSMACNCLSCSILTDSPFRKWNSNHNAFKGVTGAQLEPNILHADNAH